MDKNMETIILARLYKAQFSIPMTPNLDSAFTCEEVWVGGLGSQQVHVKGVLRQTLPSENPW